MMQIKNLQKGFTLIELLVVIAIIGILSAIGIPAYQGFQAKAKYSASVQNHVSAVSYIMAEVAKCNSQSAALTFTATKTGVTSKTLACPLAAADADSVAYFLNAINDRFDNPYKTGTLPVVASVVDNATTNWGSMSLVATNSTTFTLTSSVGPLNGDKTATAALKVDTISTAD